jgi:uncharacterized membrane protein
MKNDTHRNEVSQSSNKPVYKSLGLAGGLFFGGIIGLVIGNPIIFAGGGMVLGLALGTALDERRKENVV